MKILQHSARESASGGGSRVSHRLANCQVRASTLKFLFCPSTSQLASALLSSPPQHTQPREGQTPPWGAVSWRSRTHDPSQSRDQDSSWRVATEAAGRGEHGPLPQPVTSLQLSFSRQLHPPPQRGPARPPNQGLPLSDQRQPDLLQLFSKRTSSPRDQGSSWRKIPASPGV